MTIKQAINKFLREQKVKNVLKKSEISVTTDLIIVNIKRNSESLKIFDNLKLNFIKSSDYFRGSVGQRYISIIVTEQFYTHLLNIFQKYIVSIKKKVAGVLIDCSNIDSITGIITFISSIFAKDNINLHGLFTSQDDIILIIDENIAFEYMDKIKKILKI